MTIIDICIECKTKLQDDTSKPVSECPNCNRPMCEYHIRPKLVHQPNFADTNKKQEAINEIIKRENGDKDDGHPCFQYTMDFWKKHDKQYESLRPVSAYIQKETEEDKIEWKQLITSQTEIHAPATVHTSKKLFESSYEPPVISHIPTNHHQKTKPWKKIAGIFAILIIIGLSLWAAYPSIQQAAKNPSIPSQTPTATPTFSIPNITSSTPAPITTPALTTSYVEVDYQIVGWFYSNSGDSLTDTSYNYTYLVLNVTVTNYGYSQVNVIGNMGFSVAVNSNDYTSMLSNPSVWGGGVFNGTISDFYGMQTAYTFSSELPDPATLLNTGSVNGIVIFQLGSPTVYPPQPQILNEPFTLQYSVAYGDSLGATIGLSGPYATVVINQIG